VVELAMAARLPNELPSILFHDADHFPDLHRTSLSSGNITHEYE
jgi:hypothetical protein